MKFLLLKEPSLEIDCQLWTGWSAQGALSVQLLAKYHDFVYWDAYG